MYRTVSRKGGTMSDTEPVDQPDDTEPAAPPPAAVASVDALPDGYGGSIHIRGREFHVVAVMPGMSLIKLAQAQRALQSRPADGDPNDPRTNAAGLDALASFGDMLINSIVPDERVDFEQYLGAAWPPIGMTEMRDIVGDALAVINARPTQPASQSPGG